MIDEYDKITAKHYRAFRPPLHDIILEKSITNKTTHVLGLDIGCGTGQSSTMLAHFCNQVVGIDPSIDMISKGINHPNVSYSLFNKKHINFEDNTFDIITLAGSLWYAKSQELLNEVIRVGAEKANVIVYDFEVLLEDIRTKIGFDTKADDSSYNHEEDFSGLDNNGIVILKKESERVQLQIAINDLAHLILSVKGQYTYLSEIYGRNELYKTIVNKLRSISDAAHFDIQANTFFTSYCLT